MKHNMHKYNAQIKQMLESGMLHKQIAYKLKVSMPTLRCHLLGYFNIEKKIIATYTQKKQAKADILKNNEADIMESYHNGISFKDIADKYGVTYNLAYQFIVYRNRRHNA